MAWTGPASYVRARDNATEAAAAHAQGDLAEATALAAICQVYVTLALTAATALHEEYQNVRSWRQVTGQE